VPAAGRLNQKRAVLRRASAAVKGIGASSMFAWASLEFLLERMCEIHRRHAGTTVQEKQNRVGPIRASDQDVLLQPA
jgi:hypothetical protein